MPRRVDHDARRRQIIGAVVRITLRGGLSSATFREVAAEAGVSVRLIQYYFGTKDQLLLATQQQVAERATARIVERVTAAGAEPRQVLYAALTSFIPTDDESREAMLMFVALYTASLTDRTLARAEAQDVPRALHTLVVKQLRRAKLPKGVQAEKEAALLTAAVPSLAQGVLDGMHTAEQAMKIIDYALARLLGPVRRRTAQSRTIQV